MILRKERVIITNIDCHFALLSQNRNYAKFKPPQFGDGIVRANWDPRKTPTINLQNLGLQGAPNSSVNSRGLSNTNKESDKSMIQLFDVPDSDTIAAIKSKNKLPVSIEDQEYIVKCLEKHGTDYKKMSRDIKINNMQHTEEYLRKIGSRFLLLSEKQRRVDIPESLEHLMVDN